MADGTAPIEEAVTAKVEVRLGTPAEVDEVMRLALMGVEENAFVPVNKEKLLQEIWSALNLHQGAVGVIGDEGGEIEGAVLLRVGNVFYSDANLIEEKAIFVSPAYRSARGGRAARLAEFSKWMADKMGLPLIIGVLSAHRVEAKIRMYSRIMGPSSGAYWIYWPAGHANHADPQVEDK